MDRLFPHGLAGTLNSPGADPFLPQALMKALADAVEYNVVLAYE